MTTVSAPTLVGRYTIDPDHSRIGFVARHAMVTKVRGSFARFEGSAEIGEDPSACSTSLTISSASISTNQAQRDTHVRGADFLDVETHPEITFRSTAVDMVDDTTYRITGDLTIRDITRPVSVDFDYTGTAEDPFGNVRAGFEGTTTILRSDFGITFNAVLESGGVMVSDKIGLQFDISAVRL